ncbi:unnamed protein product [Prorocentrum cordatum]|nr:unnamed protein product [Polarella glacialis]
MLPMRAEWRERTIPSPNLDSAKTVLYATTVKRKKGDYADIMEFEMARAANTENDCSGVDLAFTELRWDALQQWRTQIDDGRIAAVIVEMPECHDTQETRKNNISGSWTTEKTQRKKQMEENDALRAGVMLATHAALQSIPTVMQCRTAFSSMPEVTELRNLVPSQMLELRNTLSAFRARTDSSLLTVNLPGVGEVGQTRPEVAVASSLVQLWGGKHGWSWEPHSLTGQWAHIWPMDPYPHQS